MSNSAEERLSVFKNMAEADPENELAHFSLGKAYTETKQWDHAEKSLRRTLELSPGHSQAQRLLGEALIQLGKKDAAVVLLEEAIVAAHEKGEWKPRNEMQALLESIDVEPPRPGGAAESASPAPTAGPVGEGEISCQRCKRVGPQLDEAPFPTPIGQEVYEKICVPCWREWIAVSIKVINEYRLNLMLPEAQATYDSHLHEFLGVADAADQTNPTEPPAEV
jgi:Fe-S cluster biosynthesis and repair protein YggX